MKASVIHQFGNVDVLKYEDISTPKARPKHLVIKVLAAGVNRFDHYLREGSVVPELSFPHILGADAAGEVAEVGAGVTGFEIGERVIPMPGFPTAENEYAIRPATMAPSFALPGLGIPGTYAQYIEIPAQWVVKDTTGLSAAEAASLPMVLATSVRSVKQVGEVQAGHKVLVHTGNGGAGSMQIQVAKALGAQVATTVRKEANVEFAKEVGADLVINTSRQDFVEAVKEWSGGQGVDVAIDSLGGDVLPKSIDAVRPFGVIVAYGFVAGTMVTFDIRNFFFGQKQLRGSMAGDIEDLTWGLEQVRAGRIKPLVDRTLPLHEAAEAHRLLAQNETRGNVVLLPWAA